MTDSGRDNSTHDSDGASGNYTPTEATVRAKLERSGSLFATDEVAALVKVIDSLRSDRDQAVEAMRVIQRKYVRTASA